MNLRAKPLMIQGTMSNVGKSLITAAFCRIFAREGLRVAPFKSQNMALNSFVTPCGLEIGRAQAMQAEASFKDADPRMNPILLKPLGDSLSQVVLNGMPYQNMEARNYYANKKDFIPHILKAYESLAAENDVIIIEGAGSPAEINLNDGDIVNMGLAEMVQAPVILAADIDRGGVFASLYGTAELLPNYKKYFKGALINKFRGDVSLLTPAFKDFETKLGFPILGVIPYLKLNIDDEDSLACNFNENKPQNCDIDIAIIKLPRISNFTDVAPFSEFDGVGVRYASKAGSLKDADMIIIPGTKNTLGDLRFLKENGLFEDIKESAARGVPIIGICGGYQMMGCKISDPSNCEGGGETEGFGFFEGETVFSSHKTMLRTNGTVKDITGFFNVLNGLDFSGYEIHMGKTSWSGKVIMESEGCGGKVKNLGEAFGNILGTYIHGFFDEPKICGSLINALCRKKNLPPKNIPEMSRKSMKNIEYDKLASSVKEAVDMKKIISILNLGI